MISVLPSEELDRIVPKYCLIQVFPLAGRIFDLKRHDNKNVDSFVIQSLCCYLPGAYKPHRALAELCGLLEILHSRWIPVERRSAQHSVIFSQRRRLRATEMDYGCIHYNAKRKRAKTYRLMQACP